MSESERVSEWVRVSECVGEWVNEWVSEWVIHRPSTCTKHTPTYGHKRTITDERGHTYLQYATKTLTPCACKHTPLLTDSLTHSLTHALLHIHTWRTTRWKWSIEEDTYWLWWWWHARTHIPSTCSNTLTPCAQKHTYIHTYIHTYFNNNQMKLIHRRGYLSDMMMMTIPFLIKPIWRKTGNSHRTFTHSLTRYSFRTTIESLPPHSLAHPLLAIEAPLNPFPPLDHSVTQ